MPKANETPPSFLQQVGQLVDNTLLAVYPKAALMNKAYREIYASNSYDGASKRAMPYWNPFNNSADADLTTDLPALRAKSRDLVRNNAIASGAIETIVEAVVGRGITPNPKLMTDVLGISTEQAKQVEKAIMQEWTLWANGGYCSLEGHYSFAELQRLAVYQQCENGDAFVQLALIQYPANPYFLKLNFIEADRVCNPSFKQDTNKLAMGVERDNYGRPFRIHVLKEHPGGFAHQHEWQPLDIYRNDGWRNVLHLTKLGRPSQSRGVPLLASVLLSLKHLDEYADAELKAAKNQSIFSLFINSENPQAMKNALSALAATGIPQAGMGNGGSRTDPSDIRKSLPGGMVFSLNPNEKIQTVAATHPNSGFAEFFQATTNHIAIGMGLPQEVMTKKYDSSYSASRAAILEAWRTYRVLRKRLIHNFCEPIYQRFLYEAVLLGRLDLKGYGQDPLITQAWASCSWHGETQGSIDPVKDAVSSKMRLEQGLTTLEQETSELTGEDWELNLEQRKYEQKVLGDLTNATNPKAPANG
jgi:lambda family phage portal protein